MIRPLPIVFVLLAIEMAMAAGAADSRTVFSLAVVRRDGILIPFAAFDGRRWSNAWPPPQLDLQIPINLASVPKGWWKPNPPLAEWQFWRATGPASSTAPSTIRVSQPDWVDAHCVRQIGLRSDYRSAEPIPPPAEQPYPKDGLAVSPPQPVERIEMLGPGAERSAVLSGLRERFNKAEREAYWSSDFSVPRETREAVQPDVEMVYAFGDQPRAFYVEANRIYRRDGRSCWMAFGTGWFVQDRGKTSAPDMAVDLLRCDKYGATYMLPLGAMRADGRTFWIVQYSGWDHERYVVIEIKNNKVEAMVRTWGGGC